MLDSSAHTEGGDRSKEYGDEKFDSITSNLIVKGEEGKVSRRRKEERV